MKVKDMIEKLSKLDPELDVRILENGGHGIGEIDSSINKIEMGHSKWEEKEIVIIKTRF